MESTTPRCPKCNCESITMILNRSMVYEVNSIGMEEFEGEEILSAIDVDLIDTDETGTTIYCCTGTDCKFESENLVDFNPS